MINQGKNVPDKTITAIVTDLEGFFDPNSIKNIIVKPPKSRGWFAKKFYNCPPLIMANQYGFQLQSPIGYNVIWNGGNAPEDMTITPLYTEGYNEHEVKYPVFYSNFGYGILTVNMPVVLRTPPGVNLIATNPINYITNGYTVLSGVVETDNLRNVFTYNIKINSINKVVFFPANYPISSLIPIPRYFADDFKLVMAENVFDEETIIEELQYNWDHAQSRKLMKPNPELAKQDRDYLNGRDVYGNKYPDHQRP
jgi:hypothetical protein